MMLHAKDGHEALPQHIRLGCKWITMEKTLAYYRSLHSLGPQTENANVRKLISTHDLQDLFCKSNRFKTFLFFYRLFKCKLQICVRFHVLQSTLS
jgi:hypothetical protein